MKNYLRKLQVILHTYIDSLRDDENREVNKHGKPQKVKPHLNRTLVVETCCEKYLVKLRFFQEGKSLFLHPFFVVKLGLF